MWDENNMEEFKKNALDTCREFLAGQWKDVQLDNFGLKKISGGYSNKLYLCSIVNRSHREDKQIPNEVLLRIRGPINKDIEVIIQEAAVCTILAERNLGPKIYGFFDEGRLEEFIPSVSMKSDEVAKMAPFIARELAKIQTLRVPSRKNLKKSEEIMEELLKTIENNVDMIEDPKAKSLVKSGEFRKEYEWSYALVKEMDPSTIVFCQGDLHGGNILLKKDVPKGNDSSPIVIIDFEFAVHYYRSFDIAGHFVHRCNDIHTEKYPHFECDKKKYPTKEEQEAFIDTYLDQMSKEVSSLPKDFCKEREKQKILKEVEVLRMNLVFMYNIWAFFMAIHPERKYYNLGFYEFGLSFYEFYEKFKEEYLRNKKE